ncbi:MAG: sn-glycerol-3-phosphate ABC transporter ATP-binding protein UgpC [Gammaproteobacteria bacterium]|nr:sn-glycerol-3-phosphate ABC transporter ATP-binding protein UgpC [Gammaproteobacteria bacterium]MBU1480966.1 sn-glycerol-3-phosphate ABC transporter ATP-binding protein UgpC [Gammaproteobacteria bacterium]
MAAISMQSVAKRFGKTEAIGDVSLDIPDGEFAVFVGPSGCGKSTLLRLIAGLEDVSSGTIAFDGQDVTPLTPAERGVAMVFQSYALYPHMNVYDNMAFGLKLAKTDKQGMDERVRATARILQIEHLLERKPRELSGGQRQRVAIGRAIVRQPRVFLFDEPLSNLDAALRVQMRIELKRLHRELGTTMIYVTHDQVEAMTLADRIVVLNAGAVEQIGAPLELYHHPRNLFVAGFIGSPQMNFLSGTVTACNATRVTLDLGTRRPVIAAVADTARLQPGANVTLGLRPEHLTDTSADAAQLDGEVIALEHLGSEAYVHLACGKDQPLVIKSSGNTAIEVGQRVAVAVPPQACYLFDESGTALPRPA